MAVFRPIVGARAFARKWAEQIERTPDISHDEHAMVWAFLSCPNVAFHYLDQRHSGREISTLPDTVIAHDSAHKKQKRRERGSFGGMVRNIEWRWFRTGRTRQSKLSDEMSVLLKA